VNAVLPALVSRAAERFPAREAFVHGGSRESWGELATRVRQVAGWLQEQGVERGDRVGVLLGKDREIPWAIHGILAAGAVYVPLDPACGTPRQQAMIDDCGARIVLSAPRHGARVEALARARFLVDWSEVWQDRPFVPPVLCEEDPAYIIYTSGSTGTPKGILHSHRSGVAYAEWVCRTYGMTEVDRFANHSPLHFDMSTLDWFAAAACAGCTVIVPEPHMRLPASYAALLAEERVTMLFVVPFVLVQLDTRGAMERHDLSALRWVVYGGEAAPPKTLRSWMARLPNLRVANMYGPAEVNGVTHHVLEGPPEDDAPVPIGQAFDHAEVLLIDGDDAVVTHGEGEIVARAPTRMLGYWNRPDLDARCWYDQPLAGGHRRRFFRTRDLARHDDDGRLVFVGRADRQVKVRGYRVELDEVENALVAQAGVDEAAVIVVRDGSIAVLHGFYTGDAEASELTAALREVLPPYAVPHALESVGSFPRTTSDKIDRRALAQRTSP
jgi:amino acid adenylation domain-containing protein